jgi:hypothetical protein
VSIGLLVAIFLFTGLAQTSLGETTEMSINLLQGGSWPIAILALNWCYCERENLWMPVVGGKSLATYFKGLMVSLMLMGFGIVAVMLGGAGGCGDVPWDEGRGLHGRAPGRVFRGGDDAADQAQDEAGAFSAGLLVVPTGDSGVLSEAVIRVHTDNVLSDKVRMNGLGTAAPRTYGRMESIFLETLKAAKE